MPNDLPTKLPSDLPTNLTDSDLTERGLGVISGADSALNPVLNPVLILACGALAREILAMIRMNGWGHLHLTCLPAKLHLYPDKITEEVERAVLKHRVKFDKIFVAYADCGTGGLLAKKCAELGVEMIAGPHCYAFFEGVDAFAAHEDEITAFYLTDFLVKQFDAFIIRPLGLDKHPELRDTYFGNYEKLVYQAQVNDAELDKKAQECADRLGLPFERRFTGYGDLENALSAINR